MKSILRSFGLCISLTTLALSPSAFASQGPTQILGTSSSVDTQNPLRVKLNTGKTENVLTSVDDTWKNTVNSSTNRDRIIPRANECDCGYSYSSPAQLQTNMVNVSGVPIEYVVRNGQFVVFERPDLYYYQQNASVTWFDEVTGKVAQLGVEGLGTYASYKVVANFPYIARLLDQWGGPRPYTFGDFTLLASSYMVQTQIPLWGRIVATPVPATGTKQVLVYVSKTGNDYTWNYRASFTLSPDGSITYSTWYVN